VSDPYGPVRRWLARNDQGAFGGRAAYTPVEPDVLDPILEKVLLNRNRGLAPRDDAEAARLLPRLTTNLYPALLADDAARAAIEARVRRRWDDPPVTVEDGRVVADLGLTPGTIRRGTRTGWVIAESEHADRGELRAEEVGRRLRDLRARHPDATSWELRAEVARGPSGPQRMTYRYDRVQDRIFVTRQGDAGHLYATPPLGGDLRPATVRVAELQTLTPTGRDWMY
jgi:hypothetical protein